MTLFGNYARYYDLLYRDKDYAGEVEFIQQLLQKYASQARSILELGCGTGLHASLLAKAGYEVCGVDLSAEMLDVAQKRLINLPIEVATKLKFSQGDIRTVRVQQKFDAVISLFHVLSYQTTNQDLEAVFKTAKLHLQQNGVFIFDCWYGPAVLTEPPAVRVKRLEDEAIAVTRIAEPIMYPNENLVDVNYQVFIKDKADGAVAELQETHKMRYLFKPEIDYLVERIDGKLIDLGEWMTSNQPGFNTWGVYFVITV